VATLIRVTGDWSLAEDSAQEAFETALARWGRDGIPPNPGGWLTTVARNRAIDRLRRQATERSKLRDVVIMNELEQPERHEIEDDRLRLIFTCCHPALPLEARVALTLRTVAGLTTPEIARAFLVPEATMAQRIVRAKAKIKNAGIPFRVPEGRMLDERLPGVLAVLYLLFSEGYAASSGEELLRAPLAEEAMRITAIVALLMPDEPEVAGLLALMVLQHARRAGRVDAAGDLVPLEEQDRSLWDRAAIARGVAGLQTALRRNRIGAYQLQAVIAATHALAPTWEQTDFGDIEEAYEALAAIDPSPIVAFNHAIAVGMAHGPRAGLTALDGMDAALEGYYLLPAARADFLRRLGENTAAAIEYRNALTLARNHPERRYLQRRLAEVDTPGR
jgi:RNA polymerase sigma-70 factor (ECF subfamily)